MLGEAQPTHPEGIRPREQRGLEAPERKTRVPGSPWNVEPLWLPSSLRTSLAFLNCIAVFNTHPGF